MDLGLSFLAIFKVYVSAVPSQLRTALIGLTILASACGGGTSSDAGAKEVCALVRDLDDLRGPPSSGSPTATTLGVPASAVVIKPEILRALGKVQQDDIDNGTDRRHAIFQSMGEAGNRTGNKELREAARAPIQWDNEALAALHAADQQRWELAAAHMPSALASVRSLCGRLDT